LVERKLKLLKIRKSKNYSYDMLGNRIGFKEYETQIGYGEDTYCTQEQLIPFLLECLRDPNWPIFELVIRDALHLIRRKCYEKDDNKSMCYFNRHFMYVLYV